MRAYTRTKTTEQRFLARVIIPKDLSKCWEWQACKNARGYGRIGVNGKIYYAHRISYLMFNGPLNADCVICHNCDNTSCVNPNHLKQGSQKDNLQDMAKRGRHWRHNATKEK